VTLAVTWDDVRAARERIAPYARRTPVLTSSAIDRLCHAQVAFKCENFQKTGSFKFRGALNAVASLAPEARAHGVYAHSSGNHAQALAYAAEIHGIPAHIVMPENSNPTKVAATAGYGARVISCPPTHEGRREVAERVGQETGAVFVHPHDDPRVIAGQGTAVVELIDKVGELDMILAPVGGGGLLSGTLIAAKRIAPRARVIGCEPAGADDAYRSLQEGRRITDFTAHTIADGLRTPLGENTFAILREHVDRIVLVSEAEILHAMQTVWERMKIIIEPSSAVAVAPLLRRDVGAEAKSVGVILSGGNVDLWRYFADLEAETTFPA
jgi:threonine dehydratase